MKRFLLPALIVLALAAMSGAYSLARIVEDSRPDIALSIMPSLAPSLTAKADALVVEGGGSKAEERLAEARRLALTSLRASALNAPALRTLAITVPRQTQGPEQLLETALLVSRRDVGTQLLQLELDAANGDVAATLRRYDQALRVKPSIGATLYPVLLSATDDPALVGPIRRMVSQDPDWLPGLMAWSIDNPQTLGRLTQLVPALPPRSYAMSPDFGHPIIEKLVAEGQLQEAYVNYQSYRKAMLSGPAEMHGPFRPFDWAALDNIETGSDPIKGQGLAWSIFSEPLAKGEVLTRLSRLAPGNYDLSFMIDAVEGAGASLQTDVACAGSGSASGGSPTIALSQNARLAKSRVSYNFTVPGSACPFQWIRLHVRAAEQPVSAQLTHLSLKRIN